MSYAVSLSSINTRLFQPHVQLIDASCSAFPLMSHSYASYLTHETRVSLIYTTYHTHVSCISILITRHLSVLISCLTHSCFTSHSFASCLTHAHYKLHSCASIPIRIHFMSPFLQFPHSTTMSHSRTPTHFYRYVFTHL